MCQLHEEARTSRLATRLKRNKKVVGYKVIVTSPVVDGLLSPYFNHFEWNVGWNKAVAGSSKSVRRKFIDRAIYAGYQENTYKSIRYKNVRDHTGIYEGIHVFTNIKDAIKTAKKWNVWSDKEKEGYQYIVLPVTCYENDLVSAGTSDMSQDDLHTAVFAKVLVKKVDYETALKAKNSA